MDQNSGESNLNGDGDKQILAPADGPRENLINTAVKFLQNPKVITSPLHQKKAFLERKGLTQEEITMAVERSGVKETASSEVAAVQAPPPGYQPGMMGVNPVQPLYAPIPPQSFWSKARDLTMTSVIVASVSYAVYQLLQKYLRPWLLGKSAQEERLERLESQVIEIQKSVADSLGEVTKTLAAIQITLQNQQPQLAIGSTGTDRGISDLKTEISSLKGLLLSRSQFPPVPSTSPVLPSWQRVNPSPPSPAAPAKHEETEDADQTPVLHTVGSSTASSSSRESSNVKAEGAGSSQSSLVTDDSSLALEEAPTETESLQSKADFVPDDKDASDISKPGSIESTSKHL